MTLRKGVHGCISGKRKKRGKKLQTTKNWISLEDVSLEMILVSDTASQSTCQHLLPLSKKVEIDFRWLVTGTHMGICQRTFKEQRHRGAENLNPNSQKNQGNTLLTGLLEILFIVLRGNINSKIAFFLLLQEKSKNESNARNTLL